MMKKWSAYVLIAAMGAVIGGGVVLGYRGTTPPAGQLLSAAVAQAKTPPALSANRNTAIVQAAQAVAPSVVGITNKGYANGRRNGLVEQGVGSGVIFDSNGYIATNNHVVEGAQEITVSLADGRVLKGRVLGTDPVTDLAVVKVDAADLPAATLGDSDSLLVGEPAIAIGNPLGLEFQGSVTAGVISALNRSIEIGERKFKLIQTDAAINPGNSGGALVNADGVVIGINSAKIAVAGVEGIGFSIPTNIAKPILQSIIEKGHVVRAYLGVGAIDNKSAAAYGYDLELAQGVYIAQVVQNGPAAKAGLRKGDVVLSVGGVKTNSVAELRSAIEGKAVGEKVEVVFIRNDQQLKATVALEEVPAQQG